MKRVLVDEADSDRPLKLRTNPTDPGSGPGDDVTGYIDVNADAGLEVREVCFGMVCTLQDFSDTAY